MTGGVRAIFRKLSVAALLAAALLAAVPRGASACQLALVLAHDVSSSVSRLEYALQTIGHAEAFRDPEIQSEILAMGEIRVMLMHWSSDYHQQRITPWRRLGTRAEINAYADELANAARRFDVGSTAIGDMLASLNGVWAETPASVCTRRVIDVSGDGVSNSGQAIGPARGRLLAKDVTINGLVIVNEELVEAPPLLHYQRAVIGGPGAFVIKAEGFEDYARAFREKLLRELRGPPIAEGPAQDPLRLAAEAAGETPFWPASPEERM